MRITLLVILFLSQPVAADDLPLPAPALYDVSGVNAGDVLNVRTLPNADSDIIGELPPGAVSVEVVAWSRKSEWALVNAGDTAGWVSARFLEPSQANSGAWGLPEGFRCFGTEPFWMIAPTAEGFEMTTPDTMDSPDLISVQDFSPPDDVSLGLFFRGTEKGVALTSQVLPGRCSDGMSERAYGLHYTDTAGRLGCCTLAAP
jgi:uncharacterized membrane protein